MVISINQEELKKAVAKLKAERTKIVNGFIHDTNNGLVYGEGQLGYLIDDYEKLTKAIDILEKYRA